MATGLQTWTPNGVIQTDATAPVLSLIDRGMATLITKHPASETTTRSLKYVDLTFTAEMPRLVIYGPSSYGTIAVKKVGSSWTYRVCGLEYTSSGVQPFNWFLYDRPKPKASGAGAEAYGDDAKIVFSTFYPPINVAGFVGAEGSNMSGYYEVQLDAARKWGTAFSAHITLYENSEHYTNQDIFTYWTYEATLAKAELTPNPYDTTKKRCGIYTDTIAGGVNEGGSSPSYPSGDLGGWGVSSEALIVDVTGFV